ncbi:hypothetical protein [Peribacillus frigoritolerans]|uniref:hypothetical protein n=1 Tax=Peribacillus frigoritolerans TaxID=450367 RepID=UPI00227FA86C|nr:hypothetical protein [Peribacillus frigoritolerans]MCY9138223.1 hypothetical protein [Peribacillus frigoritolerans]
MNSRVIPDVLKSEFKKGMAAYRLSHDYLDLSMTIQSTTIESERSTVKPPISLHKEKTSFINWSLGY